MALSLKSETTTREFDAEVEAYLPTRGQQQVFVDEEDDARRSMVCQSLRSKLPRSVVVSVPSAPDQIDRVALDIAAQLGREASQAVDMALHRQRHDVYRDTLEHFLQDRFLVVDGADLVGNLGNQIDSTLQHALQDELIDFRKFLSRRATVLLRAQARPAKPLTPKGPPFSGGDDSYDRAWEFFGGKTADYLLWINLRLLQGRPISTDLPETPPSPDRLRAKIVDQLPDRAAHLLNLLCAHERTLPHHIVEALSLEPVAELGARIRLWYVDGSSVWIGRDWSRWWREAVAEPRRAELHRQLAHAFAKVYALGEPNHGLATLEAHRHFLLGGDDDLAKRYARFGGEMLAERARTLSYQKKYNDAAQLYSFLVDCANEHRLPISAHLHAYALHYAYFNRNRSTPDGAPLDVTIDGYERALELWPNNALFWSRLIRAHVYNNDLPRALEALRQATTKVPAHPNKETQLIARTVLRLLNDREGRPQEFAFAAGLIWGGHRARNIYEQDVFVQLVDRLRDGWHTDLLDLPGGSKLVFNRPVRVQVEYQDVQRQWLAVIPEIDARGVGSTPAEALPALVSDVRAQTRELVRARVSQLSAEQRLRKQRLLAVVDISVSHLDAEVPAYVWVLGELESDGQVVKFRDYEGEGGKGGEVYELSPDVMAQFEFDTHPRLARFATDAIGCPVGAVLELGEPLHGNPDDLWQAWRKVIPGGA